MKDAEGPELGDDHLRHEADREYQERNKLWRATRKLEAERDKRDRHRGVAPLILVASFSGAIFAAIAMSESDLTNMAVLLLLTVGLVAGECPVTLDELLGDD